MIKSNEAAPDQDSAAGSEDLAPGPSTNAEGAAELDADKNGLPGREEELGAELAVSNSDGDQEGQEDLEELEQLEQLLKKESDALTPDEIELREELIEKHRSHLRQGIRRVEYAQFSGPLPPPGVLANYEQVLPGAAERIFQLTEKEQASRHRENDRAQDYLDNELRSSTITQRLGQLLGSLIALGALALAFYAFSTGSGGWGVAIVIAEIAALSAAFVYSRKSSSNEQDESKDSE